MLHHPVCSVIVASIVLIIVPGCGGSKPQAAGEALQLRSRQLLPVLLLMIPSRQRQPTPNPANAPIWNRRDHS